LAAKHHLDDNSGLKEDVDYKVIDVSASEAAYGHIKAVLEFSQAPLWPSPTASS
jgi:hypothetical protein